MEQTDRSQRGGVDGGWKKLAKERTCMYAKPLDTDNNVVKAGGLEAGWRRAKRGMGHVCNSVNNKKT